MKNRKEREIQKLEEVMDQLHPERAVHLLEAALQVHAVREKESKNCRRIFIYRQMSLQTLLKRNSDRRTLNRRDGTQET